MPAFDTHLTPNPNSLKITTNGDPFIESGMESFHAGEDPVDHPLGRRLLGVRGLANVFVVPQFVTVTKHPAAEWDEVVPGVMSALTEYFADKA